MLGAIIGDIVGSRFEFNPTNDYDFELFTDECSFTDDTICTIAVADALLKGIDYGKSIHTWCRRYPNPMGGYGISFRKWVMSDNPQPYNSYGNGAAMRVSPIGMWFDEKDIYPEAEKCAACSHNHPEGIKGAEATASAIFLGRTGHTKAQIKAYIEESFGYNLDRTCDKIRPNYHHVESCQETVPEAITAFLEGESFEDVIRTAVSLGGDCDTLTCIAGSMAEAFYGVPEELKAECRNRLPEDLLEVVRRFEETMMK